MWIHRAFSRQSLTAHVSEFNYISSSKLKNRPPNAKRMADENENNKEQTVQVEGVLEVTKKKTGQLLDLSLEELM